MRSHISFLQRNSLIRLIVLIATTLLVVGAVLSLAASHISTAMSESHMPNNLAVTNSGEVSICLTPPLYDDPSYFETLLNMGKRRFLQFISFVLEKLPLRQYPFHVPNNTFWRIIPL
jgi:hypothetical protein